MSSNHQIHWVALLLSTGAVLAGCEIRKTEAPLTGEAQEVRMPIQIESDSLVQILVYGLAAFHETQNPATITAHFPSVNDHIITLAQGQVLGPTKHRWGGFPVTNDPEKVPGWTISFPDLEPADWPLDKWHPNPNHGNVHRFPQNPTDAGDARWILRVQKLDSGISNLDETQAKSKAIFQSGRFETCGLVHAPNPEKVCRVQVLNVLDKTSASEYMVFRRPVPQEQTKLTIKLTRGNESEDRIVNRITLQNCTRLNPGGCVMWDPCPPDAPPCPKYYRNVFDIAASNALELDVTAKRNMESSHADELKDAGLFPGHNPNITWHLTTPDCVRDGQRWDCSNCKPLQPTCWNYFIPRYKESMSGVNQPICPFVEYP